MHDSLWIIGSVQKFAFPIDEHNKYSLMSHMVGFFVLFSTILLTVSYILNCSLLARYTHIFYFIINIKIIWQRSLTFDREYKTWVFLYVSECVWVCVCFGVHTGSGSSPFMNWIFMVMFLWDAKARLPKLSLWGYTNSRFLQMKTGTE